MIRHVAAFATPARDDLSRCPRGCLTHDLSVRQTEVLALYATIGNAGEVGGVLHITECTVRNHMHNAYHRLGVGSAIEAYFRLGWLTVPDG